MPMGAQRVSQSRGQLVSHNKRPSGVSTCTQWVVGLYHSGGSSLCVRDRMVRPGLSRSHVRSVLMAPQSRFLTVVPDAVILVLPFFRTGNARQPASAYRYSFGGMAHISSNEMAS
jgi:hypothetical protein